MAYADPLFVLRHCQGSWPIVSIAERRTSFQSTQPAGIFLGQPAGNGVLGCLIKRTRKYPVSRVAQIVASWHPGCEKMERE